MIPSRSKPCDFTRPCVLYIPNHGYLYAAGRPDRHHPDQIHCTASVEELPPTLREKMNQRDLQHPDGFVYFLAPRDRVFFIPDTLPAALEVDFYEQRRREAERWIFEWRKG